MKLNLTREQYIELWDNLSKVGTEISDEKTRIDYWNRHFKPTYNLKYTEQSHDEDQEGWYGMLEGDPKYITLLLLSI